MIRIDNECHKDGCDDESARTTVHLESDCKREKRKCKPIRECENRENEFEEAFVRPALIPIATATIVIPTKTNTTTVQVINNVALLSTLSIDIRPLNKNEHGNVVITTLAGVTLTSFSGTYGTTGTELAAPQSYLSLQWDGDKWVPAV